MYCHFLTDYRPLTSLPGAVFEFVLKQFMVEPPICMSKLNMFPHVVFVCSVYQHNMLSNFHNMYKLVNVQKRLKLNNVTVANLTPCNRDSRKTTKSKYIHREPYLHSVYLALCTFIKFNISPANTTQYCNFQTSMYVYMYMYAILLIFYPSLQVSHLSMYLSKVCRYYFFLI